MILNEHERKHKKISVHYKSHALLVWKTRAMQNRESRDRLLVHALLIDGGSWGPDCPDEAITCFPGLDKPLQDPIMSMLTTSI